MTGILRAVGERSERALRRGIFAFAGAGLVVVALGFAGAAMVEALAALMPRFAALGLASAALFVAAAILFSLARQKTAEKDPAPKGAAALSAFASPGDWRGALNLALIEEAKEKPARAAALAALAGLILGVLEGLDEKGAAKPDGR
jgi:membrane-bound ClpP family serine protease